MEFMQGRLKGSFRMKLNRDYLTLPKELAILINNCETPECIVTIAPQRLLVFPEGSWENYVDNLRDLQPEDTKEAIAYQELLHAQEMFSSKPARIDSAGRLKLSHLHYNYLQQPQEVYITGHRDFLEVYTIEEYNKMLNNLALSNIFKGPEGIPRVKK
jgi:DNA-binding transcriptional regulator/RsmH inhibitor MraZ